MTLILGIETSCDETAASVVRDGSLVLSNVVASQYELHEEYGGVVPEIASRAHLERIAPVVRSALRDAGVTMNDLDAVAVGNRPGLIGSLVVGVAAAKALAWASGKALIGVDHVHAHLVAADLRDSEDEPDALTEYPALGLVVSGGHTTLYRVDSPLEITRLGSTIDDAIGEAYDKCAAMLGLPQPGGPSVDALAQRGDDRAHDFPVSRLAPESLDFSFSGLKTAVLYTVRGQPARDAQGQMRFERTSDDLNEQEKADICASFQRAAVRAVILKMERAMDSFRGPEEDPSPRPSPQRGEGAGERPSPCPLPRAGGGKDSCRSIVIGGGVSANSRLRDEAQALAKRRGLALRVPKMKYCMDNAAMIAALAHHRLLAGETDDLSLAAAPTAAR
ncbi:MAG: tRNA (adenosine(37)-N6)-threonylcarbamoyltransferase complex transferase subunit TsaD [Phycisphaeraceae bacterium]|nr:tRNA (adenosine(37)-N6)-threonylcarbamoyltransferase complex transferase subunit TsaD [Phycisphaeraceae bacterium]